MSRYIITLFIQVKEEDFNNTIQFIQFNLNLISINEISIIEAFEKINKFTLSINKSEILYLLPAHMINKKHIFYKNFDAFFKSYCKIVRKMVLKSQLLQDCLSDINKKYYNNTLSKKQLINAYKHVLNQYDANKVKYEWAGFWSLIKTENGILTDVQLFDTQDRDYFFEYIQKSPVHN